MRFCPGKTAIDFFPAVKDAMRFCPGHTVIDFFPEQGAASRKGAVYVGIHEHLEASCNTVMGKKMSGHWQASQSGSSIEQAFGAADPVDEVTKPLPLLSPCMLSPLDFSMWVAPMERR